MVKPGLYKHWKEGNRYLVLTVATCSETLVERVIYIALKDGRTWDRKLAEWIERVMWPDGVERSRYMPIEEVP